MVKICLGPGRQYFLTMRLGSKRIIFSKGGLRIVSIFVLTINRKQVGKESIEDDERTFVSVYEFMSTRSLI